MPGPTEGRKQRILLVDDEEPITSALTRELRGQPLDVVAVNDAQSGIRRASEGEFDLVISDNMMPDMSGLEFFSNLKVLHPQTRRVLLTGHTEMERAVQAFNDGDIHRFVSKPWDREELRGIIEQELRIYREHLQQTQSQTARDSETKQRLAQLKEVFSELKQAKTQVALHEDGHVVRTVHLSPRMRKLSVLVVDNHDGVREILVNTLRRAGIEKVASVSSAAEALQYLQSSPSVDIILSEWALVEMDGLALFNAVRSSSFQSANAPFILLSTRENRGAVEMAISSGINGYITKPFHITTLLDRMESLLPRGERESQEEQIREMNKLFYVVVNSDLDARSHLQNVLTASGAQNVMMAATGGMAERVINEKMPDVLIYDCNIRDPYWMQMREHIRKSFPPDVQPGFVITSISPIPKEYEEVNSLGVRAFVPGQAHRRKLYSAVIAALEEKNA